MTAKHKNYTSCRRKTCLAKLSPPDMVCTSVLNWTQPNINPSMYSTDCRVSTGGVKYQCTPISGIIMQQIMRSQQSLRYVGVHTEAGCSKANVDLVWSITKPAVGWSLSSAKFSGLFYMARNRNRRRKRHRFIGNYGCLNLIRLANLPW